MEYNRSSSQILKANATTNNTFGLKETGEAISHTVENSFNFLKRLQHDYVNLQKFNKTDDELYINSKGYVSFTIDSDLIGISKRKKYKESEYYNNFISLDTIYSNPAIFSFVPMIFLDGNLVTSCLIKPMMTNASTEISFMNIDKANQFINTLHVIDVVIMGNTEVKTLVSNKSKMIEKNWTIDNSDINMELSDNQILFVNFENPDFVSTSNIFPIIVHDNSIILDESDSNIYDFFVNESDVTITIFSPDNIFKVEGHKQIYERVDTHRRSSIFMIDEHNMPIPAENTMIFAVNKITGKIEYSPNRSIVEHYPNIYEINSDNTSDDYEYEIYYFYTELNNALKYQNKFKYIYRYISNKLESSIEDSINTLLYTDYEDKKLQNYFLTAFDYVDSDYIYNHSDFFSSDERTFDFDYKIAKMFEFIDKDPTVLSDYGKGISVPGERYYLETVNLDLNARYRTSTEQDVTKESDIYELKEPSYMFRFRNEGCNRLHLRFFIDGLLCTSYFQIHSEDIELIYIPVRCITDNSYIEVEKFNEYSCMNSIRFDTIDTIQDLTFDKSEFKVSPTLYDLYVCDENYNRIDRSLFSIYALVDKDLYYEVSDSLLPDNIRALPISERNKLFSELPIGDDYITDKDDFYVNVDDKVFDNTLYINEDPISLNPEDYREPVKYMLLGKLKIKCNDPSLLNKELRFIVNKVPYIYNSFCKGDSLLSVRASSGVYPWRCDGSYVRIFINGRLIDGELDALDLGQGLCWINTKYLVKEGSNVSVDISQYSYTLEYTTDTIPEDYVLDISDKLSKPFSTSYYDVYLNGRKLNDNNICAIGNAKIALFNVNSRKNLSIYRRDRDNEYYGFNTKVELPIDELLNSNYITEEDKSKILDDIISDNVDVPVIPGKDEEPDYSDIEVFDDETFHKYSFYLNIIIPRGVTQANNFMLNSDMIKKNYPEVYELYSDKISRIVMQPNIHNKAEIVLLIGKDASNGHSSILSELSKFIGEKTKLGKLESVSGGKDTIISALVELYKRMGDIYFKTTVDNELTANVDDLTN